MEVPSVSHDIRNMNQTQLLGLIDKMNLYWRVNSMIWEKLEELRKDGRSDIPEYTEEKIMSIRRDIPLLLNFLGLWEWVRELLTFTTGTRSWEDYIEPREYRGELVGLIGLLDSGLPVLETIVSNYDYERIQTICNIISTVTSDSRIWIPDPTRAKLVHLNQILCDSEYFWRLKIEHDFGTPTSTPASYKKFYRESKFTMDLFRDMKSGARINWTEVSKSPNVNTKIIEFTARDRQNWQWDFWALSANLAIPLEFIVNKLKSKWNWPVVSGRPDVTIEFVMEHPDASWSWRVLSLKQPLELIFETANDPRYSWDWDAIFERLGISNIDELIKGYGSDPNLLDHWLFKEARFIRDDMHNHTEFRAASVRRLLRLGANPNVTWNTNTPLMIAVSGGTINYAVVRELLAFGADPNIQNVNGETALSLALKNRRVWKIDWFGYNTPVVKMLLEHGASPTIPDNTGRSALDYVRENPGKFKRYGGRPNIVQSLLESHIS